MERPQYTPPEAQPQEDRVARAMRTLEQGYERLADSDQMKDSLKYIAHWCQEPKLFREYLPEVQKTAQTLIDGIELVQDDHYQTDYEGTLSLYGH